MPEAALKILVVEDEMIIAAKISMYLTEMGHEVTGIIPRSEEALLHLEQNAPDIALLDIQLKGKMDGIELAEVLQKDYHIPVVFLTANIDEDTFQRARATKPYAFMAKPFKKLDLKRTLELAAEFVKDNRHSASVEPALQRGSVLDDRIFIFHKGKKVKIMFDDIIYVEAERNYCRIITSSEKYLLTMPMKSLEASLSADTFQRVHRSHIVNLNYVDEIDESAIVLDGHVLGLSKSYRKEFLQRIKSV